MTDDMSGHDRPLSPKDAGSSRPPQRVAITAGDGESRYLCNNLTTARTYEADPMWSATSADHHVYDVKRRAFSAAAMKGNSIFVNQTPMQQCTTPASVLAELKGDADCRRWYSNNEDGQDLQVLLDKVDNLSCAPMEFRSDAWTLLTILYIPHSRHLKSGPKLARPVTTGWSVFAR